MRYAISGFRRGVFGLGRKRKGSVGCGLKDCAECKQAICGAKVFCGWLKKFVEGTHVDDGIEIVVCPRFELEPLEYRVYRRT